MNRLKKIIMAVNHPNDKRIRFVVDGKFYFPTQSSAEEFIKKINHLV